MTTITENLSQLANSTYTDVRLQKFSHRLDTDWDYPGGGLESQATRQLPEIFKVLDAIISEAGQGEPMICPVDGDIWVKWHTGNRASLIICPITLDSELRITREGKRTLGTSFNLLDNGVPHEVQRVLASASSR